MKKIKKVAVIFLTVVLLGVTSLYACAADSSFGSAAVDDGKTYTLDQMLTYAVQDEYLHRPNMKKS